MDVLTILCVFRSICERLRTTRTYIHTTLAINPTFCQSLDVDINTHTRQLLLATTQQLALPQIRIKALSEIMSSSNLVTINSPEQFKEVLSRDLNKVSVLDFWATWAQPCEKMNEVVKEASEKYKDVLFLMVSFINCDRSCRAGTRGS